MERLTKGTKEYLVIPVTDSLGNLTSIGAASYDIYTGDDAASEVVMGAVAVVDGMKIFTLVDTTDMDEGPYDLFVQFEASPEAPRLGPFRFRVDD